MTKTKLVLIALFCIAVVLIIISGLTNYLSLDYFKSKQSGVNQFLDENPITTGLIFTSIYFILTSLSIPAAGILTLISGAIFGFFWGLILVAIASSLGATCAFLLARYLFHDAVQRRFARQLGPVNDGINKDGALYLFMLRMAPVVPYFVINATMAMTPIKTRIFFPITLLGMLPISAILVNAGLQISQIESVDDILSLRLIASLALIGVFPLLAKKTFVLVRRRRHAVKGERLHNE